MTSTVEEAPNYRFARKPKWMMSHALVLLLVGAMLIAGVWQVNRHGERSDRNEQITARLAEAPVPLGTIAPPGVSPDIGEQEQFRRVVVTGQYRPDDEVLVRNRTFNGAPGWWVLTPFVTDGGWAVAVNRGWIPIGFNAGEERPGTEAPTGRIEIVGTIQPARLAEGFQVADPAEGRLLTLGRPDVARLAEQVEYDMSSVVVRIDPATADAQALPTPLELPPLDAGPHISYAAQWFIFTLIALGGYPLVLRRVARGKAVSAPASEDVPDTASLDIEDGVEADSEARVIGDAFAGKHNTGHKR